jgi:DDE superfamily endonuclease
VLRPHLRQQWCIPPHADAEFACAMEDVLEVYHRPYDPRYPVVGLDEVSKQLVGEARTPIPAAPGRPARVDYEYVRHGTVNLFLLTGPLAGWRYVEVTERRTAVDFAHMLRFLAEEIHPEARKVVLVLDNLNTHKLAALYQAFPPEQARRLAERFEAHYTPKHGSWLNVAEVELSVLARQCLGRRFADRASLEEAVVAWQVERNERGVGVDWQFRTKDARIRLKHLYPSVQD